MSQSYTIPFGDAKGTPITAASERDLQFCISAFERSVNDPSKAQYKANNTQKLHAFQAELARRAAGGAVAQAPATESARAITATPDDVRKAITVYGGAHDDAKKATEALMRLAEVGHMITPAPACGELPQGTSIVISATMLDFKRETYKNPGGFGLGKTALQKLGGGLGLSRNSAGSYRKDDASCAEFVHFCWSGWYRDFDLSKREVGAEKIIDLREGSPQCKALRQRCEEKFKKELEKAKSEGRSIEDILQGDYEKQIRDMRLFALEHAETKAMLRAIRSFGIRSSYAEEELRLPFFAARIQFTGRSEDPEIRRLFAEKIANSMLDAEVKLFGPATTPTHPEPHVGGYTPPPVGTKVVETTGEPVDDDEFGPDGVEMPEDKF